MWVCPIRVCSCRFQTEGQTWDFVNKEHGGSSVDLPIILPEIFRTFLTTELRRLRGIAERRWSMTCDSKEVEQQAIAKLYVIYKYSTSRASTLLLGHTSRHLGFSTKAKTGFVGLSDKSLSPVTRAQFVHLKLILLVRSLGQGAGGPSSCTRKKAPNWTSSSGTFSLGACGATLHTSAIGHSVSMFLTLSKW